MRRKRRSPPAARKARPTHGRQRQHLIDACISALHIYGPSRTTVEKVVAIADMSPGIVRFYFDSKAAMLVASLKHLAAEFEERVLNPVADLKGTPVAALERLVDLYLDPEIASARKVSVWYSFWGEASSRQEYYDICGQKDERFAALVHELIERLIVETAQPQLDPDGIALGLIGVLEMLWQGFAFQAETAIDRAAARHRCMAYLRSVFPGQFALNRAESAAGAPERLPAWSYDNARLNAVERDTLFRGTWQLVGHESQLAGPADYLAADLFAERALVLRDRDGRLRAFRNSCPAQPHALVAEGTGSFGAHGIECRLHGLSFALDGQERGARGAPSLHPLDLETVAGLVLVRAGAGRAGAHAVNPWRHELGADALVAAGPAADATVAADWKLIVEQCLELSGSGPGGQSADGGGCALELAPESDRIVWEAPVPAAGARVWSRARYRSLLAGRAEGTWRRIFLPPNLLAEIRPDGITVLQILPAGAGRSRVLRREYSALAPERRAAAAAFLAHRQRPWLRSNGIALIESIQSGMVEFGYEAGIGIALARAPQAFRAWLKAKVPSLAHAKAPADWR